MDACVEKRLPDFSKRDLLEFVVHVFRCLEVSALNDILIQFALDVEANEFSEKIWVQTLLTQVNERDATDRLLVIFFQLFIHENRSRLVHLLHLSAARVNNWYKYEITRLNCCVKV